VFNLEAQATKIHSIVLKSSGNGFSCCELDECVLGCVFLLAYSHVLDFTDTGEERHQLFRRYITMNILHENRSLDLLNFNWIRRVRYHRRRRYTRNGASRFRYRKPCGKESGGCKGCIRVDRLDEMLAFTFFGYFFTVDGNHDESFVDEDCVGEVLSDATLFVVFVAYVAHFHLGWWCRLL